MLTISGREILTETRTKWWGDRRGPPTPVALPESRAERAALKGAGWMYSHAFRGWVKAPVA